MSRIVHEPDWQKARKRETHRQALELTLSFAEQLRTEAEPTPEPKTLFEDPLADANPQGLELHRLKSIATLVKAAIENAGLPETDFKDEEMGAEGTKSPTINESTIEVLLGPHLRLQRVRNMHHTILEFIQPYAKHYPVWQHDRLREIFFQLQYAITCFQYLFEQDLDGRNPYRAVFNAVKVPNYGYEQAKTDYTALNKDPQQFVVELKDNLNLQKYLSALIGQWNQRGLATPGTLNQLATESPEPLPRDTTILMRRIDHERIHTLGVQPIPKAMAVKLIKHKPKEAANDTSQDFLEQLISLQEQCTATAGIIMYAETRRQAIEEVQYPKDRKEILKEENPPTERATLGYKPKAHSTLQTETILVATLKDAPPFEVEVSTEVQGGEGEEEEITFSNSPCFGNTIDEQLEAICHTDVGDRSLEATLGIIMSSEEVTEFLKTSLTAIFIKIGNLSDQHRALEDDLKRSKERRATLRKRLNTLANILDQLLSRCHDLATGEKSELIISILEQEEVRLSPDLALTLTEWSITSATNEAQNFLRKELIAFIDTRTIDESERGVPLSPYCEAHNDPKSNLKYAKDLIILLHEYRTADEIRFEASVIREKMRQDQSYVGAYGGSLGRRGVGIFVWGGSRLFRLADRLSKIDQKHDKRATPLEASTMPLLLAATTPTPEKSMLERVREYFGSFSIFADPTKVEERSELVQRRGNDSSAQRPQV